MLFLMLGEPIRVLKPQRLHNVPQRTLFVLLKRDTDTPSPEVAAKRPLPTGEESLGAPTITIVENVTTDDSVSILIY